MGEAIETVFGAIHKGNPTNDLIAIKYLEALAKIANGLGVSTVRLLAPYYEDSPMEQSAVVDLMDCLRMRNAGDGIGPINRSADSKSRK